MSRSLAETLRTRVGRADATELYQGIKNIRLGPSLPAFVTPPVLSVLVDKFQIAPITTPEADLAAILG